MNMKKKIEIEIEFTGTDKLVKKPSGWIEGGIKEPDIKKQLDFTVYQTFLDEEEDDIWNPGDDEVPFEGGLQIIINGTKNGYKELAKYFLALSELDISEDPDFHEYIDNLISYDGKTNIQLIFGKED